MKGRRERKELARPIDCSRGAALSTESPFFDYTRSMPVWRGACNTLKQKYLRFHNFYGQPVTLIPERTIPGGRRFGYREPHLSKPSKTDDAREDKFRGSPPPMHQARLHHLLEPRLCLVLLGRAGKLAVEGDAERHTIRCTSGLPSFSNSAVRLMLGATSGGILGSGRILCVIAGAAATA